MKFSFELAVFLSASVVLQAVAFQSEKASAAIQLIFLNVIAVSGIKLIQISMQAVSQLEWIAQQSARCAEKPSTIERRLMSKEVAVFEAVRQVFNGLSAWGLGLDPLYARRMCVQQWILYCIERVKVNLQSNFSLWMYSEIAPSPPCPLPKK